MRLIPVILAGGRGQRLWPISRADIPKPFLARGDASLFMDSLRRVKDPDRFLPPVIVTGNNLVPLARQQAQAAGIADFRIIAEPEARNTAAPIAAAARLLSRENGGALLHIMPSDHRISDDDAYRARVMDACVLAEGGKIVLVGAVPDRPSSDYGYIETAQSLDGAAPVSRFVEKPRPEEAERLIAAGALWNTGTVTAGAGALLSAFECHAPELLARIDRALGASPAENGVISLSASDYSRVQSVAFDRLVLEELTDLAVVRAGFGWSDLGTWPAVYQTAPRDGQENATEGPVALADTNEGLFISAGPAITAVGLSGIGVIADKDAVLVAPLERLGEGFGVAYRGEHIQSRQMPGFAATRFPGGHLTLHSIDGGQSHRCPPHDDIGRHIVALDQAVIVETVNGVAVLDPGGTIAIPAATGLSIRNDGMATARLLEIVVSANGAPLPDDIMRRLPSG